MRNLARLFLAIGILLLIVPPVSAQCAAARSFGGGGMAPRIAIDTTPFQDISGAELAQMWETGTANATGVGTSGSCPSDGSGSLGGPWWAQGNSPHNMPPFRWINGFIASTGCTLPECPADGGGLTVLVEDRTADGQDAGFVIYSVDETLVAGSPKRYDHARTGSGEETTIHSLRSYPTVDIIASSRGFPPPLILLQARYNDVGDGVKAVEGEDNTPLPGSDLIDSYDLLTFFGSSPPGRLRSEWDLVKSLPYYDTEIIDMFDSQCSDFNGRRYYAIGLTFDGIPSQYVGRASLPIQCSPNIAEPGESKPRRPSLERRRSSSGR